MVLYDSDEQELEWGDIKVKGLIILKCSLYLCEMQARKLVLKKTWYSVGDEVQWTVAT